MFRLTNIFLLFCYLYFLFLSLYIQHLTLAPKIEVCKSILNDGFYYNPTIRFFIILSIFVFLNLFIYFINYYLKTNAKNYILKLNKFSIAILFCSYIYGLIYSYNLLCH